MNPLRWKGEHLLAWLLTTLLGALAGLLFVLSSYAQNGLWSLWIVAAQPSSNPYDQTAQFALELIQEGLGFGALFAGVGFYIVKLARS